MVADGRPWLCFGECPHHVEAVLGISFRQRRVEDACERGQEIRQANYLVSFRAGGNFAGPADHEWLAETALPLAVLAAAERAVDCEARFHCGRGALITRVHDTAIVACENDERVV